jgi:replicative DNA helicase
MYGDSLVIKFYPTKTATISTIRSHLQQLRNNKFYPDLVIVDYADLLKPTSNYNDQYADLGATFADLRGLAGELNIPVWTATQVNRAGIMADAPDIEHVSDSLQKMMIADIAIAIAMTKEERAVHRARLFIQKNRNGPAKREVQIHTAYDRMCFYRPGMESAIGAT